MPSKKKPTTRKRRQSPEVAEKRRQAMENNRLVKIYLRMEHSVNNRNYGPGWAEVPNALAQQMRDTEQRFFKSEESFRGRRGVIIGRRGRSGVVKTIDVPYETFDSSLGDDRNTVSVNDIKE